MGPVAVDPAPPGRGHRRSRGHGQRQDHPLRVRPDGRAVADVTAPAVGAEVTRWYHHDQLGTTRALTDNTGVILATYAYTPYGEPPAKPAPPPPPSDGQANTAMSRPASPTSERGTTTPVRVNSLRETLLR